MSFKVNTRYRHRRRAGEPWVSNNRVLNGGNVKKNGAAFGRNPNFDTDETKLLIQLWGDPKVQRTLITTHKKHAVICQLSNKMRAYGYNRSAEEITTRIKNLKCFYNRLKKDMESSQMPSTEPSWKHFHEMDAIMTRPIFSVRPNEIPAPSLKYQLEKEREERAERRKLAEDNGGGDERSDADGGDVTMKLSADHPEKKLNNNNITSKINNTNNRRVVAHSKRDLEIVADVEVAMNDEMFVAIANAAEQSATVSASTGAVTAASEEQHMVANDVVDAINGLQHCGSGVYIKQERDDNELEEVCGQTLVESKLKKINVVDDTPNEVMLVVPKKEPVHIDIDSEDDENNALLHCECGPNVDMTSKAVPRLPDMSQLQQRRMLVPLATTTLTANTETVTTTPICVASGTATIASQLHGKISLVPTNFLMQQPRSILPTKMSTATTSTTLQQPATVTTTSFNLVQNALNTHTNGTPLQSRILLTGTQINKPQSNKSAAGIVTTGPGGMKVLLVNTEQAVTNGMCVDATGATTAGSKVGGVAATASVLNKSAIGTVLPQQLQQQIQKQQLQQVELEQINEENLKRREPRHYRNKRQEESSMTATSKRDFFSGGMRTLLRQLFNAQMENNDIQHQRLALERERLDFEKSIAERFLATLPTLFNTQNTFSAIPQYLSTATAAVSTTSPSIRMPPKLVFTTATVAAVPTTSSTTPTTLPATVFPATIMDIHKPNNSSTQSALNATTNTTATSMVKSMEVVSEQLQKNSKLDI